MQYDTWNPYDPVENDSPEKVARLERQLQRDRGRALHGLL